jgi:hypothetical protein
VVTEFTTVDASITTVDASITTLKDEFAEFDKEVAVPR